MVNYQKEQYIYIREFILFLNQLLHNTYLKKKLFNNNNNNKYIIVIIICYYYYYYWYYFNNVSFF